MRLRLTNFLLVFVPLIQGFIAPSLHHPTVAQNDSPGWSAPLNLFETEGRASEAEIITDAAGIVHVFWAYAAPRDEDSGSSQAIYHTQKQDGQWSRPVDILISPGGRVARFHSVAVDARDYLHLVWSGGDAIYYSRAPADQAGNAHAWTGPQTLALGVTSLEPAIASDEADRLYVVWTQAGAGLVFSRSEDGGQRWTLPQTIFEATSDTELARWGRIALDEAGRLHVVLTHVIREVNGVETRDDPNYLYYLRSQDQGKTWTEPFEVVSQPDFGEINVVTFGQDTVHLVWNGRAGRHGRYHRWSTDGGRTWSDVIEVLQPAPEEPIGTGGLTGFPALAVDSTGVLHMVSATGGGDYYFRWQLGEWGKPVLISPGLDGYGVTGEQSSLEQPSIAISQGNQLHVVFHDGFERIWYTTSQIEAPLQTPVPLPSATDETIIEVRPSSSAATEDPPSTPETVTIERHLPAPQSPLATVPPAVLGIVPVVVGISIVVLIQFVRRK